jgi:DNA-binding transcriptional LysR family regulator
MDRFESMSAFVAVIEAGGFSAASRKLNMPLATVSRKVSELEGFLRVSLISIDEKDHLDGQRAALL